MLSLTCLYLLQLLEVTLELSISQTKVDFLPHWISLTEATDSIPDYWNHGPIVIPRQDSFPAAEVANHNTPSETATTKNSTVPSTSEAAIETNTLDNTTTPAVDTTSNTTLTVEACKIHSTTPIVVMRASAPDLIPAGTEIKYTISNVTSKLNDVTVALVIDKNPLENSKSTAAQTYSSNEEHNKNTTETTTNLELSNITSTTSNETTNTTITPELIKPDSIETVPFSVFLEKFFKIFSNKKSADVKLFIDQFKDYVSTVLTSGQLSTVAVELNSIIAKTILLLDHFTPDEMLIYADAIHNKLANRKKELPNMINDLLDHVDELYDEAEEEAMQAVLYEAKFYPNTKNKDKIAQGFVDYVFLKPMLRVAGTVKGKSVFEMIITAVKNRNEIFHKEDKNETKSEDAKDNIIDTEKDINLDENNGTLIDNAGVSKNYRKNADIWITDFKKRYFNTDHKNKLINTKMEDKNVAKDNYRKLYKKDTVYTSLKSKNTKMEDKKVAKDNYRKSYKKDTMYTSLKSIKRRIETVLGELNKVFDVIGKGLNSKRASRAHKKEIIDTGYFY